MKKFISLFILFISFCSYPSDLVVSKLPGRSEKYLVESAPDKNHPLVSRTLQLNNAHSITAARNVMFALHKEKMEKNDFSCAIMVRATAAMIHYIKKDIIHILAELDACITYWRYQQAHPYHHFFHKAPIKWGATMPQEEEVNRHIKMLQACQLQHYQALGRLMVHEEVFNPNASLDEQYAWLNTTIHIIELACSGINGKSNYTHYDPMLRALRVVFRMAHKHTDVINEFLYEHKIPNRITRNWIKYTVGTTSVIATLFYAKDKYKGTIKPAIKNGYDSTCTFYTNLVQRSKSLFFEDVQSQDVKLRKDLDEVEKDFVDSSRSKSFNDYLREKVPEFEGKDDKYLNFIDEKDKENVDKRLYYSAYFWDVILPYFSDKIGKNGELLRTITQEKSPEQMSAESQKQEGERGFVNYVLPPKVKTIINLIDKAAPPATEAGGDFFLLFRAFMVSMRTSVYTNAKQYKILFGFAALTPIALTAYAGWYSARAVWKKITALADCAPLRFALVDVGHLLNQYGDVAPKEMAPEDFGKLVYFVHKLQDNHTRVPYVMRERFLNDIGRLQSPVLSAQKKLISMELMYRTYDFLSPTFKHS